jgi:hypothetical protein
MVFNRLFLFLHIYHSICFCIATYWCNPICFLTYYLGLLFNQPTKSPPQLGNECCHHFYPHPAGWESEDSTYLSSMWANFQPWWLREERKYNNFAWGVWRFFVASHSTRWLGRAIIQWRLTYSSDCWFSYGRVTMTTTWSTYCVFRLPLSCSSAATAFYRFTPKHLPPTSYNIVNNRKVFAFPSVNVNDIDGEGIMPHWMAGASK